MTTTNLSQQIEALVHAHLAQIRSETSAAVERAFASVRPATRNPTSTRRDRAPGKRRDPAALAELAERLHAEIMAEPGALMTVYAKRLGATVRELNRPMAALKRARRLRTAGARNNTRYFPLPG